MCHNGSWNFAFRKTSTLGSNVIVEQCDLCDDYRKRTEEDIEYIDA